jgi:hypothetical protein
MRTKLSYRKCFEFSTVINRVKIISDYEHATRLSRKSVENEHIVMYVLNYDYKAVNLIPSLLGNYFATCHMQINGAVFAFQQQN